MSWSVWGRIPGESIQICGTLRSGFCIMTKHSEKWHTQVWLLHHDKAFREVTHAGLASASWQSIQRSGTLRSGYCIMTKHSEKWHTQVWLLHHDKAFREVTHAGLASASWQSIQRSGTRRSGFCIMTKHSDMWHTQVWLLHHDKAFREVAHAGLASASWQSASSCRFMCYSGFNQSNNEVVLHPLCTLPRLLWHLPDSKIRNSSQRDEDSRMSLYFLS
jgi:hypothetical protein